MTEVTEVSAPTYQAMARFNYTVLYVADVKITVEFYQHALGLSVKDHCPDWNYARLERGCPEDSHYLAFASTALMQDMLGAPIQPASTAKPLPAFEISFQVDDVETIYEQAVSAGAIPLAPPTNKPWGQRVAFLRDCNGMVFELAQLLESDS